MFFKITRSLRWCFNHLPSSPLSIFLHSLSQVFLAFMWFNNLKKRRSPCGHSPHPQAALLLSRIVLPLLHNAYDAILYFFFSVQLTTVPWWIKSRDYKNIQTDQIGFQESLSQSKVKIAVKETLGYLEKEGRSRQGEWWCWGGGGYESKPRLFWVIWAWNSTASITEWLRAIWLCGCHSAGERRM